VISDRGSEAGIPGTGVRQAVIRFDTVQTLATVKEGIEKKVEKEVVEYFVIQKVVLGGRDEGPWIVWGTTQETDLARYLEQSSANSAGVGGDGLPGGL
jgi:hypothetical protein